MRQSESEIKFVESWCISHCSLWIGSDWFEKIIYVSEGKMVVRYNYWGKESVLALRGGGRLRVLLLLTFIFSMSDCVLRLPEFAEPIKNVTLYVGSDVEFSCDVRHLGTYRVAWSWKKDEDQKFLGIGIVKIISDPRVHVSRIQKSDEVTQFNLYVYNIRKEDAGTYHCSVNSNPMIEQFGTLEVTGEIVANGNNGKIVNGKNVGNSPKPVRKGIVDQVGSTINSEEAAAQHDVVYQNNLNSILNHTNEEGTEVENSNDNSTSLCIDLSEIWERARERVSSFLMSLMNLTYSYMFS